MTKRQPLRGMLIALILAGLTGCAGAAGPTATPRNLAAPRADGVALRKSTVLDLFAAAGPNNQRQEGETVSITATCSLAQGRECWLGPQFGAGALASELGGRAIDEIGADTIKGGRQSLIMLRCSKPAEADGPLYCQLNGGDGWQDYALGD